MDESSYDNELTYDESYDDESYVVIKKPKIEKYKPEKLQYIEIDNLKIDSIIEINMKGSTVVNTEIIVNLF